MGKLKEKLNGTEPGSYSCHEALHMADFMPLLKTEWVRALAR